MGSCVVPYSLLLISDVYFVFITPVSLPAALLLELKGVVLPCAPPHRPNGHTSPWRKWWRQVVLFTRWGEGTAATPVAGGTTGVRCSPLLRRAKLTFTIDGPTCVLDRLFVLIIGNVTVCLFFLFFLSDIKSQ